MNPALSEAIEEAVNTFDGMEALLYLLHETVADQPRLCDALAAIERMARNAAAQLDAAHGKALKTGAGAGTAT